jgi:hypothetical protein
VSKDINIRGLYITGRCRLRNMAKQRMITNDGAGPGSIRIHPGERVGQLKGDMVP